MHGAEGKASLNLNRDRWMRLGDVLLATAFVVVQDALKFLGGGAQFFPRGS